MERKIYIAVSGCKNGFSVFYTTPGLDMRMPGVTDALTDMRRYLRISDPLVDYYAVDYLHGWRIYTVYRSSIDSAGASGAFIAVSLVIPDELAVRSPRLLLDELMAAYFGEYYHPQFGTPQPGKIESGDRLERILAAHAADISRPPLYFDQAAHSAIPLPLYMPVRDLAEAEEVFSDPYHSAYLNGSKLIIFPERMLANPEAGRVAFNTDIRSVRRATTPSDRLIGQLGPLAQQGTRMRRFVLNGTDYTPRYSQVCLRPEDNILVEIQRPDLTSVTFQGTVSRALSEHFLVQRGKGFIFGFLPYELFFNIAGVSDGVPDSNILLPHLRLPSGELLPMRLADRRKGSVLIRRPAPGGTLVFSDGKETLPGYSVPVQVEGSNPAAPVTVEMSSNHYTVPPVPTSVRPVLKPRFPGKTVSKDFAIPLQLRGVGLDYALPASIRSSETAIAFGNKRFFPDERTGQLVSANSGGTSDLSKIPLWVWIAGGSALVLIAVLIVILLSRGKETRPEPSAPEPVEELTDSVVVDPAKGPDPYVEYFKKVDTDKEFGGLDVGDLVSAGEIYDSLHPEFKIGFTPLDAGGNPVTMDPKDMQKIYEDILAHKAEVEKYIDAKRARENQQSLNKAVDQGMEEERAAQKAAKPASGEKADKKADTQKKDAGKKTSKKTGKKGKTGGASASPKTTTPASTTPATTQPSTTTHGEGGGTPSPTGGEQKTDK